MTNLIQQVHDVRSRLVRALQCGQSHLACLRLWSNFVRMRDGNMCVKCECKRDLAAHHIFRKSFLSNAQFEPGNGITLCRKCHKQVHGGFNGKPDMGLPMDAQGGEKAEDISTMLEFLVANSRQHRTSPTNGITLATQRWEKLACSKDSMRPRGLMPLE